MHSAACSFFWGGSVGGNHFCFIFIYIVAFAAVLVITMAMTMTMTMMMMMMMLLLLLVCVCVPGWWGSGRLSMRRYFESAGYFSDRDTAMKLKCCSYPTTGNAKAVSSDNVEPASLGVGPHKDYGFLALIDQDVAGLQVGVVPSLRGGSKLNQTLVLP
jgi:hypothetical protein